jgi:hypothetical protein
MFSFIDYKNVYDICMLPDNNEKMGQYWRFNHLYGTLDTRRWVDIEDLITFMGPLINTAILKLLCLNVIQTVASMNYVDFNEKNIVYYF